MAVSIFQFVCVVSALALAVSAQHAKMSGTISIDASAIHEGTTYDLLQSANGGGSVTCTTPEDSTETQPNFDVEPYIKGKVPIKKFVVDFDRTHGDQGCDGGYESSANLGFFAKGSAAGNANSICSGDFSTWQFTVYMGQGVTGCNAGSNGIEKVFTAPSGSCDDHEFTFDLIIPDHPTVTGRFTMKMAFNVDCGASGASTAPFSSAVTALKSSAEPDVMKKSSSSSSTCFPASASAQMADGSTKLFSALQVGDSILTGKAKFSEVHMFSHHYPEAVNPFVQLTTAAGQELRLTAGHYLYVNGSLAKASSVHVGDTLEDAAGAPAVVVKTAVVKDTGLYNPHTLDGDVVVNGIRTSTYTDAIHPTMAHALLAPIRALYSMGKAFEL